MSLMEAVASESPGWVGDEPPGNQSWISGQVLNDIYLLAVPTMLNCPGIGEDGRRMGVMKKRC